jgi:hypothetical protein
VIYVGLDDTDILDAPGTNQLARHLVKHLAGVWHGQLITRHQLLEDPRVPCTRRNGCVAIAFEPLTGQSTTALADAIGSIMMSWCPEGSDPGLCITSDEVPQSVIDFGRACQRQLMTQQHARELAAEHRILLRGLSGTEDGVIGALAAVGLMNTRDDGRVIYVGNSEVDHYEVSGIQAADRVLSFGVDEIRRLDNHKLVAAGTVDVGKRLRPNYRAGKIMLFVTACEEEGIDWHAERVI